MIICKGTLSFLLNDEPLGIAFRDKKIMSENIIPRVFLGNNGCVVKVCEGYTQLIEHANVI